MKYKFNILNLDCANCANKIEKKLNEHPDIEKAIVNFNNLTLTVYTKDLDNPIFFLEEIIHEIEPEVKLTTKVDSNDHCWKQLRSNIFLLISGLIFMVIGTFLTKGRISQIFIIISYLLLLSKVIIKAFKQLRKFTIDENLLITISCLGAYLTNNIHEGLMVIILYDIGKILENIAVNNSRKSIKELMNIKPEYANLLKENNLTKVNPELVKVGDTIVIKPGEKIPLDGVITKGNSKLNTQSLTGESKLSAVSINDKVLSGTINTSGLLHVKVSNTYESSTVSKILSLIDSATDRKAKTETFVAKASKIYTPIVLILALITAIISPFIFDLTSKESIYRALVFLVVACPCAIAISVPLSYFSGIGIASKNGILIKGSDYLDALSNIKKIIFDKTGTITTGKFTDYKLTILDNNYQKEDIIKYYVSGESLSNHPIAKSITDIFQVKPLSNITNFKEISGKGITYKIDNLKILIGSANFCHALDNDEAIYLNIDKHNIAKLVLKDGIRSSAKKTIQKLHNLEIKTKMYTGDNEIIAKDIASSVDIDSVSYNLLPEDKYHLLEKELANDENIAFIGDGINDAPSLALAKIGISLGGIGSAAAIESSDIVIMDDNLEKIVIGINISKYTNKIIKQNLVFAIFIKIAVLILSFLGISTMWQAVFADTGVTLLTIINTTRILRKKY